MGMSLEETIKARALETGFDLVGVAPLDVGSDLDFARQWVKQGRGGQMRYLCNPKRHDPRQVLPSAQSVVCVGLVYNSPFPYSTEIHSPHKPRNSGGTVPAHCQPAAGSSGNTTDNTPAQTGWISRYAWGRDYHRAMKFRLEALRRDIEALAPDVETRVYVDTGPIVERAFARFSGIGWMGKNTCLINQEKGSWFFLGVILTSLALIPDMAAPDRCGSCSRCIQACPTGALDQPYIMDASRCIAYLTIELKGSVPVKFREAMGVNLFGCDICQDVCPWNSRRPDPATISANRNGVLGASSSERAGRGAAETSIAEFQPRRVRAGELTAPDAGEFSLFHPSLARLATLTEEEFRLAFRNSPIKRVKFRGFLRNLCVAIGNSGNPRLIPVIQQLTSNEDQVVREHALWALSRMQKCDAPGDRGI